MTVPVLSLGAKVLGAPLRVAFILPLSDLNSSGMVCIARYREVLDLLPPSFYLLHL